MASLWRRAMVYLGLGPDEEYDDIDEHHRSLQERPMSRYQAPPPGGAESAPHVQMYGTVRTLQPQPAEQAPGVGAVSSVRGNSAMVHPIAATAKPYVLLPSSFNDAQEVADKFKSNVPVIVNLQGVDRDLRRRLIDFASGLCYGLDGAMEKVADQVYLLTPSDVEVPPEERRRLQERGLVD